MKRKRHIIVTLVGSTKPEWQEQYRKVNRELALNGFLVISVSMFKTDVPDIEKHRELLESIHFQKIDMADVVVLIHPEAIGEHTKMEIEYCKSINKSVIAYVTKELAIEAIEECYQIIQARRREQ